MISEVTGDILLSKAQVIAHGVAPNDPFHQGLALQLRERWPALYKDFRHYCQTYHPKPGGAWLWMGADGQRVASLFTQEAAYEHGARPGHATAQHVGHALRELRHQIEAEKFRSVALPRLATGVGGMEWRDVQPLIAQHLGDLAVPVIVYTTYRAGEAAAEAL